MTVATYPSEKVYSKTSLPKSRVEMRRVAVENASHELYAALFNPNRWRIKWHKAKAAHRVEKAKWFYATKQDKQTIIQNMSKLAIEEMELERMYRASMIMTAVFDDVYASQELSERIAWNVNTGDFRFRSTM